MVSIRWKNTKASPSVKQHLETKLTKIYRFKNVNQETTKAEIVFYPHENSFTVRLNISIIGSDIIRSEEHAPDVLSAINKVIEKTLDQIRRLKTKQNVKKK